MADFKWCEWGQIARWGKEGFQHCFNMLLLFLLLDHLLQELNATLNSINILKMRYSIEVSKVFHSGWIMTLEGKKTKVIATDNH